MKYDARSLFHPPLYTTGNGNWSESFLSTANSAANLEWDLASIMSTLAYGYPLGDRTLFKQISRNPWISEIDATGAAKELEIPAHGYFWMDPKRAAEKLFTLLCEELVEAAKDSNNIYILLSGGLDSRVVAGVIRSLKQSGKIHQPVTCVTWGLEDSRDVQYARILSERLGFEWIYAPLTESSLEHNIKLAADEFGTANSPIHLHRMDWFRNNAPSNSIVFAGSYGDSVGRAEFSRRTVLELLPISAFNYLDLLDPRAAHLAEIELNKEITRLHVRTGLQQPRHVKREHEQQAHYMRGLIAHTMSVINHSKNCHLYQAFTSPKVYGFMWSLHPAMRTDKIYESILEIMGRDIASMPWARNNKSLKGEINFSIRSLNPSYHDYGNWVRNIVSKELERKGEKLFFSPFLETNIFNENSLKTFIRDYTKKTSSLNMHGSQAYSVAAWLLSFRNLQEKLNIKPAIIEKISEDRLSTKIDNRSPLRRYISNFPAIRGLAGTTRRYYLRRKALKKYPPIILKN